MPDRAADQVKRRRVAWLVGVSCLACCLVPVLGVAGVAGALVAVSVRQVLVGLAVAVVAGGVAWWIVRRGRQRRCASGGCTCHAVPS